MKTIKRDKDNETAYILRKKVEGFMSQYYDSGVVLYSNYSKDLDLHIPVNQKEEINTLSGRFVEGFMGHSFKLTHRDYPKRVIPVEVRVEMRAGRSHVEKPHYLKMLSKNRTRSAVDDARNYFYDSVFFYLSSPGTVAKFEEFDYYAIEFIKTLIDNSFASHFYYASSKGNGNRICISPWRPEWISITGGKLKKFISDEYPPSLEQRLQQIFGNGKGNHEN